MTQPEEMVSDDTGDVEELLVDDFDGQCSRTYPDNHCRIVKWRMKRNEERLRLASMAAVGAEANEKTESGNIAFEGSSASMKGRPSIACAPDNLHCKDWTTKQPGGTQKLAMVPSSDETIRAHHPSSSAILADHDRDFGAKKRRLMTSASSSSSSASASSLDHSKSTSTLTTESSSTGVYVVLLGQ